MILSDNTLQLDIKVSDRYRRWFSTLGSIDCLKAGCVILGDSDVEYELSPNVNISGILNGPYAPVGIKHKLLYNGIGKNLSGSIKCFVRKVLSDGTIQSLYNYNLDEVWTSGSVPPVLANGKDWDNLDFDGSQMGYILFFETVLDYYVTDDGVKKRLIESYDISVAFDGSGTVPNGWDVVIDNVNGSLLLSKVDTTAVPPAFSEGIVTCIAQLSKMKKDVTFSVVL